MTDGSEVCVAMQTMPRTRSAATATERTAVVRCDRDRSVPNCSPAITARTVAAATSPAREDPGMARAHDLLPIPPRGDPEVYPGMEMTPEQMAAVAVEECFMPGDPPVRVLVYRPKDATGTLPLIVEIHGGAFS